MERERGVGVVKKGARRGFGGRGLKDRKEEERVWWKGFKR